MVRRSGLTVQAKEDALKMFKEGKKLSEVMRYLMAKYGWAYSTCYGIAAEVEAYMELHSL